MDHPGRTTIQLRLGPWGVGDVQVRSVSGVEALSEPYAFELDLLPVRAEPIELAPLLGAEARLSFARPAQEARWVNGICVRAEHTGVEAGHPTYRVTLAPRLALLARGRKSRVYQGQSAPEIVREVLDRAGIAHRSALSGAYPARDMCLQYAESDLVFVARLLEEEGIAYWFEHGETGHVLVLGDAPRAFAPLTAGDELPFRPSPDAAGDVEHIARLGRKRCLRPTAAMLRDHDFEHPAVDLSARADAGGRTAEHYEYPGRYTELAEGARLGRIRLEELRADEDTWTGSSNCFRLRPGATFQPTEHPTPGFCARLLVARVEHDARQQTGSGDAAAIEDRYHNRFQALGSETPFRPPRSTPRPLVNGPQTATVVGAAGEEIHPDRYGRVRIQFHWDRDGRREERSSAWVRLAHPWAGAGCGAVFVPRVGQEVVVRFLEGDPDRPVVMGTVYNGDHPVPAQLPAERTQSTLRTSSSPGGEGNNELRFEDARGQEQILLHGQKDARLETGNDKRQEIQGAEILAVEGDRTQSVLGSQQLVVRGEDARSVSGDRTLTVAGRRAASTAGHHAETVGGLQAVAVGGFRVVDVSRGAAETVGLGAALTVGGGYAVSVGAVSNVAVGGAAASEVGGARFELIGAEHRQRVGGDLRSEIGGVHEAEVKGKVRQWAGKDHVEDVSGKTGIEVTGAVTLHARSVDWRADRLTVIVGGELAFSLGDSPGAVQVAGPTVSLQAPAKLKAPTVSKPGAAPPPRQAVQAVPQEDTVEDWTIECAHHAKKGERAIIRRGSRIAVVAYDGDARKPRPDRVTLRYRHTKSGKDLAPRSLQADRCDPGAPSASPVTVSGELSGSFHAYAFDVEYRGEHPQNLLLPAFWKAYRSRTSYRLTGTPSPLLVEAYHPHRYKLELQLPPFGTFKTGSKWSRSIAKPHSLAHPGPTAKEPPKPERTSRWESSRLKLRGEEKGTGVRVPVKSISYAVDGASTELNVLDYLNTLIDLHRELVAVIESFKENAPKIGWYLDANVQFLQGGAAVEWYWKEPHELKGDPEGDRDPDELCHEVYQYIDVKASLTIVSVELEAGIGVSGFGFKAQVFLKVAGKLPLELDGCRDSPDGPPGFKVPLTLQIPGELGVRVEAGNVAKVEGKGQTGFEFAVEAGINQPRRSGMVSFDFSGKWTGLKTSITASIGLFGIQGSYTREWTLAEEKELWAKRQWPAEAEPPPQRLSRDRVHAVVVDTLTKGLSVRVIRPTGEWWKPDHHWTVEEMASRLDERIFRAVAVDPSIVATSKAMEGLSHAIRQDLDRIGERTLRNWIEESSFLAYVNGPELGKHLLEMKSAVSAAQGGQKP